MYIPAAAERFLSYCRDERRLSALTLTAYATDLADFAAFVGKEKPATSVSEAELKNYLHRLNQERGLSVATVKRRFATLQALYRWLARDGVVVSPFLKWAPRLKRPRRLPRAISRLELSRLIARADHRARELLHAGPTKLALVLMAGTGLRVSELCNLNLEDLGDDGRALHVRGKGARDRVVFVSNPDLQDALKGLKRERLKTAEREDAIFLNRRGRRLTPPAIRSRFKRLDQPAGGTTRLTPHVLRHTAATLLIEEGVDIRYVQKLLGHASIATTEIYTHVADEALRRVLARADILGAVVGTRRKARSRAPNDAARGS